MALGLEGRHVVVTGGAGALGGSVVQAFVDAGAVCHLPVRGAAPARAVPSVDIVSGVDVAEEASVVRFFAALPPLWASVHVAGGFLAAPIEGTSRADLERLIETNVVTTFLCCR